ncbi:aminopeptidase [Philodulcilactobacillus myokoensis]|uniref:Aminopeptidase n=1 Tax=Philodulcilactobacillus myokoensis TaxID=2929573 RepID=A0A9W6AZR8_9LACO|nr:C1 family peptidase [Philodulcilactobacillus myokoensis]GLB46083.1 aminopeptidase [Philodulcilactobacillus myokoensis]
MSAKKSQLTKADLEALEQKYQAQPQNSVISHAVMENGINKVAYDPNEKQRLNRVFSDEIKTGNVSDQKRSGRCWLFAALNVIRHHVAKKYNIKNFELSQSYLFFWDRVERANFYFDRILKTADRPTDDRELSYFLELPDDDGGEWAMAIGLIQKYGVMPTSAFPESYVADHTSDFGATLELKLRRDGIVLRKMVKNHASDDEIKQTRHQMLSEVYRMSAYAFGVPPKKFDFEYRDDKNKYHVDRGLTPKLFYEKYIDIDLDDYVVLSNYPDKKMGQLYASPDDDNVVGGAPIQFLNLPMKDLKRTAIKQIQKGEGVWFGNDVEQQMAQKDGYLDANLYRRSDLFDVDLKMSKKDRFEIHEATESHAMTFTGVDIVDNQPTKWKVENSWGGKVGENGYFIMTDDWMNDYVYQVVVRKEYLTKKQQALLTQKPVNLMPWE